jgi:hypothetical protein
MVYATACYYCIIHKYIFGFLIFIYFLLGEFPDPTNVHISTGFISIGTYSVHSEKTQK